MQDVPVYHLAADDHVNMLCEEQRPRKQTNGAPRFAIVSQTNCAHLLLEMPEAAFAQTHCQCSCNRKNITLARSVGSCVQPCCWFCLYHSLLFRYLVHEALIHSEMNMLIL